MNKRGGFSLAKKTYQLALVVCLVVLTDLGDNHGRSLSDDDEGIHLGEGRFPDIL